MECEHSITLQKWWCHSCHNIYIGVYDLHDSCEVSNEIQILQYIIESVVTAMFSEYRAVIKYDHSDVW